MHRPFKLFPPKNMGLGKCPCKLSEWQGNEENRNTKFPRGVASMLHVVSTVMGNLRISLQTALQQGLLAHPVVYLTF